VPENLLITFDNENEKRRGERERRLSNLANGKMHEFANVKRRCSVNSEELQKAESRTGQNEKEKEKEQQQRFARSKSVARRTEPSLALKNTSKTCTPEVLLTFKLIFLNRNIQIEQSLSGKICLRTRI